MRGIGYALLFSACFLGGCGNQNAASTGPRSPGRYAGIGTFEAGRLWQEAKDGPASKDSSAARLADDEHVIVVLDSHTGEVRQCGDHSGFCVAMNPWQASAVTTVTPVKLSKHAADLDAEEKRSGSGKSPAAQNENRTSH